MSQQCEMLDVPNLIKEGKIHNEITVIKQMEDMVTELFASGKKSSLTDKSDIFIWNIKSTKIIKIEDVNFSAFNTAFEIDITKLKNVVITGSFIRSVFGDPTIPIKQELVIVPLDDSNLYEMIDVDDYKETYTCYYKKLGGKTLNIIKKTYKSPSNVILSDKYFKRVGYFEGDIYVSSMFLIEYFKNIDVIKSNLRDPVYDVPLDTFDIYEKHTTKINTIFDMIERKDINAIIKFNKFDQNKMKNNMNCVEYTLNLYIKEECQIIKNCLRQTILFLNSRDYVRPPFLFAQTIGIQTSDPELYKLLSTINKYNLPENTTLKNIDDINDFILNFLIMNDKDDNFFEYLKSTKTPLDKKLIDNIISYKPSKLIKKGIINDYFKEYITYKIILCTEELDYFKCLDVGFNIDIAVNFLEDIVSNGLIRSFYYLYKNDPSILYTKFEDNDNILHCIDERANFSDMIHLVIKLDKEGELLNMTNDFNETPIVKQAKKNPNIVKTFLELEESKPKKEEDDENFIDLDVSILDRFGNSFLHNLCVNGSIDTIKIAIREHPELLNLQNNALETPVLLAAKHAREDIFYMLHGAKADLSKADVFGNTTYHYVCKNEICIGMAIENIPNKFGFSPEDYCKISPLYYYFIK